MNIPNIITIFRIILIPVYLYFFYSKGVDKWTYAGIVFVIAGISDLLDGYIARKYNLESKLGALLDPLADKLFVFAILITFTVAKIIPSWILIVMGLKEVSLIIGAGILYLFTEASVIPSDKFGKLGTVFFYLSIISIVLKLPLEISKILFTITVIVNILAFINYFKEFLKIREQG